MFASAGAFAHIVDSPQQQGLELRLFLLGKILHQPLLIAENGGMDGFVELATLIQNVNALEAAVI